MDIVSGKLARFPNLRHVELEGIAQLKDGFFGGFQSPDSLRISVRGGFDFLNHPIPRTMTSLTIDGNNYLTSVSGLESFRTDTLTLGQKEEILFSSLLLHSHNLRVLNIWEGKSLDYITVSARSPGLKVVRDKITR